MPEFYLFAVILLFGLAISDLVVGVSNDAVNFLNSAVGSKVAPRHVIMIVASAGILVGATFSSGMMEVARKGIFNPEYFFFADVMVIFLAVMLTDIILLDLFNTFGLPTSTTVSIVFELLGASVMMALIKVTAAGEPLSTIAEYLNTSSALIIIAGIFLSIAIAFTIGVFVQYVSRLLFTFHYQRRMRVVGAVWAGVALATLTYFLLIKGLKGASFVSDGFVSWMMANTTYMLLGAFLGWMVIMQLLLRVFKVNILRIIVLFGTFALAMAFAGNDLVNFIGVPIAGFESYKAWVASAETAGAFNMAVLGQAVRTPTYLLLLAGLIMIITLWLSRKARSVTDTEVNLGRQDEGLERFSPNALSRGIVRYSRLVGRGLLALIPTGWLEKAEYSFRPFRIPRQPEKEGPPAAFDLVRASVNLTVASALIALATSYKLPLSTTYVSFMVAMGTSLADRAWGRDSAVYRVAGVLNVVGGWFATAIIAFTVSAVFAFVIFQFEMIGVVALVLLAVFFIYRSFAVHRRREKEKEHLESAQQQVETISVTRMIKDTSQSLAETLDVIRISFQQALEGLRTEDLMMLKTTRKSIKSIRKKNLEFQYTFHNNIRRIEEQFGRGSRMYLLLYDMEQDIIQSINFIVNACRNHIENSHEPLAQAQDDELREIQEKLDEYLLDISRMLQDGDFEGYKKAKKKKKALLYLLEQLLAHQVEGIKRESYSARNSLLFFSLLLETKDLIAVAARFVKLYHRMENQKIDEPLLLVDDTEEQEV